MVEQSIHSKGLSFFINKNKKIATLSLCIAFQYICVIFFLRNSLEGGMDMWCPSGSFTVMFRSRLLISPRMVVEAAQAIRHGFIERGGIFYAIPQQESHNLQVTVVQWESYFRVELHMETVHFLLNFKWNVKWLPLPR